MKKLLISEEIYSVNSLMKAAYKFTDEAYFLFSKSENKKDIVIEIELKNKEKNVDELINELKNELLHEKIRENLSKETKNIRELLMARALYGVTLEQEQEVEISENIINLDFLESNEKIDKSYLDDTFICKSRY